MTTNNTQSLSITQYLGNDAIKKSVADALGAKAPQFIASVSSLVANNKLLATCDKKTLLSACLTAASLSLPINQNLGFAYIIPYRDNKTGITEAQFQMGWKGFVQLAQRSGLYKTINVTEVREGEIAGEDYLSGELTFNWEQDKAARSELPVIGYAGHFVLLNGFSKTWYMTVEELKAHANRYSQSYRKNYGPWKDDFDAMCKKTVLKLLISKYGPMSIELEKALVSDQAVEGEGVTEYPDNEVTAQEERVEAAEEETNSLKMGSHVKDRDASQS
jgi:recombination protein RecT